MRLMPFASGAIVADFTIVRLVGSGPTGEVYLAQQQGARQPVALKVLHADVSGHRDFQQRFEQNFVLAQALRHPCIVSPLNRGVFTGRLWVASEYIDGADVARSLDQRFPDGMPVTAVSTIVLRMGHALDFAHRHGLLHRHFSPGNVLLENPTSETFRVLLTDFGTARRVDTLRELSSTVADDPLVYSAPEDYLDSSVDGRSDQYSLAATAFHLLTGVKPTRPRLGASPRLTDTHPLLSRLDPVLTRALAVDPIDRYTNCTDFAQALAAATRRIATVAGSSRQQSPSAVACVPPTSAATQPRAHRPEAAPAPRIPNPNAGSATPGSPPAQDQIPPARSILIPAAIAVTVVTVLAVAGVMLSKPRPLQERAAPSTIPTASPPSALVPVTTPAPTAALACGDPRAVAAGLELRDKLAQLLMVGVTGYADARDVVRSQHVGGIFIGSWTDLSMLQDGSLKQLETTSGPLPLAVSVDEEGGRVDRLSGMIGRQDAPRVLVETRSVQQVHDLALNRGLQMRNLGITVDFAPVVDVTDAPDSAVIGDRSFSDDPKTVVEYAGAYAQGLREAQIQPVLKHFPGHGHGSGDSHMGAVITPSLEQLKKVDLVPYGALTTANPVAVMMGHLQVPGLTRDEPASLSRAAYDLLRSGDYGGAPFPGLVYTDDLSSMGAINQRHGIAEAVLRALQAGADTALWISTDKVAAVLDRLVQAVNTEELSLNRVNEALDRVALSKGLRTDCGG
ncbi:beta-glucosidase-like glycosyl hydrolase [Mycobacterium sp. BK558]|nr:beta-glucosidase-like glycosyl hydrolase [Mycobacterium sp. BK558]